jgi:CRISPR-associated protein Csy1
MTVLESNMRNGMDSEGREELRTLMESFLQKRLEGKLEKTQQDDIKRKELIAQFHFETWLSDAARRVSQIQLVTHSLKAIHPDAKGSNLYAPPESLKAGGLVGTHSLGKSFRADVVGNASALDVYKFLRLELDGRTILDRVLSKDEVLIEALAKDRDKAKGWVEAFAGITQPRSAASSHTRAKQVYFLVGDEPRIDGNFHMLAPLYATSLAHEVFRRINEDRFSPRPKAARQARRNNRSFDCGYNLYPDLAVQKMGGANTQNISQLNCERGGNNYLLASLPPSCTSKLPLHVPSVLALFGRRQEVRRPIRALARFLNAGPASTMWARGYRNELLSDISAELLHFAAEIKALPAGWSADNHCNLLEAEKLWLDPGRAGWDQAFRDCRKAGAWPGEVRQRFARWVKRALVKASPARDREHSNCGCSREDTWLMRLNADRCWINMLDELERELAQ